MDLDALLDETEALLNSSNNSSKQKYPPPPPSKTSTSSSSSSSSKQLSTHNQQLSRESKSETAQSWHRNNDSSSSHIQHFLHKTKVKKQSLPSLSTPFGNGDDDNPIQLTKDRLSSNFKQGRPRSRSDGQREKRKQQSLTSSEYNNKNKTSNDARGEAESKGLLNNELDDLLNSFQLSKPVPPSSSRPSSASDVNRGSTSAVSTSTGRQSNKCSRLVLTDASIPKGKCTASNKCSCSKMRCTSCDHVVGSFDNVVWDASADYLFFRNNFPDYEKLRPKLKQSRGSRAYACQCSSENVLMGESKKVDRSLKWVCGRHSTSS
eukprot:m.65089 g.65089  ORF g.65089 m.65089 type:complete len:320 (-) comp11512_c0_seq1:115-1074(-)